MTSIRKAKKNGTYIKPVKATLGIDIGIGCSQSTTSYWDGKKWVPIKGIAKIHEGEPIIPRLARGGIIGDTVGGHIHSGETSMTFVIKDIWKYRKKGGRYKKFLVARHPINQFARHIQKHIEENGGLSKVVIGDKTVYEREVLGKW